MKILILYTPRSGTNSIASYFLKQNPNYEYFNQPFTQYMEPGIRHSTYSNIIKYDNVLVKSDILSFSQLVINKDKLISDFDKVLLISRKDKREQSISFMIAATHNNYLDNSKRSYFTGGIDENELEKQVKVLENCQNDLEEKYLDAKIPLFYYEDLFYGDFSELFEYLGIEHKEEHFNEILDIKNKYKTKGLEKKKINTFL
jgi:hypothetical protein